MNNIDTLSAEQIAQVLEWFAADMLEEIGLGDVAFEEIAVDFPAEALADDPTRLAVGLLNSAAQRRGGQIDGYLHDAVGVRGLPSLGDISSLLPLALALYFSLEFKYEVTTQREEGKPGKKKTTFSIKSRTLSEALRKLWE